MSSKSLDDRRKALEEEFFQRENERLRMALHEKLEKQTQRAELARASGIDDEQVLDVLLEQGIEADALAALALVPLVAVAWANGTLQDEEREAVREASEQVGIAAGSHASDLLSTWLAFEPSPNLFDGWLSYMEVLREALDPDQRQKLRADIAGRARSVAEAAGGILGLGAVSAKEADMLERIEAAF